MDIGWSIPFHKMTVLHLVSHTSRIIFYAPIWNTIIKKPPFTKPPSNGTKMCGKCGTFDRTYRCLNINNPLHGLFGQNVAIFEISRQFRLETLKLRRHCFQRDTLPYWDIWKTKTKWKTVNFSLFAVETNSAVFTKTKNGSTRRWSGVVWHTVWKTRNFTLTIFYEKKSVKSFISRKEFVGKKCINFTKW